MARREAERQKELVGEDLPTRHEHPGLDRSVAPFVGLLGTVVGIITAFQGIAATGSGGLGAVSAGIAEALVETALSASWSPFRPFFLQSAQHQNQRRRNRARAPYGRTPRRMENSHGHPRFRPIQKKARNDGAIINVTPLVDVVLCC